MDINCVENIFSKQDCEYLLRFAKNFNDSGIHMHGKDVFNDYRISQDFKTNEPILKEFLLDRLKSLNIISIPTVEYIRYVVGSKFKLHRDRDDLKGLYTYRYRTLIIQLTEDSKYKGGNLLVENQLMNRDVGSVIMFNSKYLHEVTELTEGTRYSLCLFLRKDDLKSSLL